MNLIYNGNKIATTFFFLAAAFLSNVKSQEVVQDPALPDYLLGMVPRVGGGGDVKAWRTAGIVGRANVKSYGAVGDGVADDTAAIQAALDDEKVNTVFLPKGTYRISEALVISRGGLRIEGDSRTATVIKQVGIAENGFELAEGQQNVCSFKSFKVEGLGYSANQGAAFHMRSKTAGLFTHRHRWEDIEVANYKTGWNIYAVPLATWINCQTNNCSVSWYLDRCDTPMLMGCGSQASSTGITEACVRSETGCFSGTIINGEWGRAKRVFDIKKGNWQVIGGNIEASVDDGVIYVGQKARLDIRKLRIQLPNPTIASSAIIVLDASGASPPQLTLGDMKWDVPSWAWKRVVVRGGRYFQVKPIMNGAERSTWTYYESAKGGTTHYSGYLPGMPIWPIQEWKNSIPNNNGYNSVRRGVMTMFSNDNSPLGEFEQPIVFVRTRWGTFSRSSLLNDRLMDVLQTQSDQTGNSGNIETTLLSKQISGHTHHRDGDLLTLRSTGKTATNSNSKRLKVYFGGILVFDSLNQTWNGKAYDLETRISRRTQDQWVASTTLRVDGEFPMVRSIVGNTSLVSTNLLKLTATGNIANDVVSEFTDVVWRKSEADD